MMKANGFLWGGLSLFLTIAGWAEVPAISLTLTQAEQQTLAFSPALKAKHAELDAAQAKVDAQTSLLWPRLTLEGTWHYVSEVPEISILPGRPPLAFGDHNNYSIGPMLSWNLWDSGGAWHTRFMAQAAFQAKLDEVRGLERTLKLQVRSTYFQAQLALEQVRQLVGAYKLFGAQYQDIRAQYHAGSSTRIDSLSSHQELLSAERQLHQAQLVLSAALRDLYNLTGTVAGPEMTAPIGADLVRSMPPDWVTPTLWVTLDPLEVSLQRFGNVENTRLSPHLPQIVMLAEMASMVHDYAAALATGHLPKFQASAKTSIDYPNGPVLETVHQNTFAVNGSLSLFEFGRISNQVAEQDKLALSGDWQTQGALLAVQVAWQKAQDQLTELKTEERLDKQGVSETEDLARLVYDAYRAGRSSYLDVQSANYRALGAKIQAARTHVQMLLQLALLDSLSENEVK
jgi:outer membrane protein TolC